MTIVFSGPEEKMIMKNKYNDWNKNVIKTDRGVDFDLKL